MSLPATSASPAGGRFVKVLSRNSVLLALLALIIFGSLRYENFLSAFNVLTVLRYNSMFALVALGMSFVIMSGGIAAD